LGFIWFNYSYITLRLDVAQLQDEVKQMEADRDAAIERCHQPGVACNVSAVQMLFDKEIMNGMTSVLALEKELSGFVNSIILVTLIITIVLVVVSTVYHVSAQSQYRGL
jgi:hypothetical protein